MQQGKIRSFTNLEAWRKGHLLAIMVFKNCEDLPKYDGLRSQMERAVVSITSNIAEGFGRETTKDKTHFYIMARGSIYELQNQLLIAKDTGKIQTTAFSAMAELSTDGLRLLHGLIRSLNKPKASS